MSELPDPRPLRAWQRRALTAYLRRRPADFLAVATPGAGKTAFALRVARELLDDHTVQAVTVVTPTEHLKNQWSVAATELGIALDPGFRNAAGRASRDFTGVAVTYAQVAAHPALHRARTEARRTLVILDEVHHGGDALSWGDAVREAFAPATRRLALTGTPFRSDDNPIPFVHYARGGDGVLRSSADHTYGYAEALGDGVVRPVLFLAYSGEMRWRTSAGEELQATLGEPLTVEATAHAWRTALDPKGDWIPRVLTAADQRLTQVRATIPDAGGLVIASDRQAARAYARILHAVSGESPTVVLSDEPKASAKIAEFASSRSRWLVAVRMVSEGVDVPRLAVGVYATSVSTPLYFAQAVGRFVRARSRGETASLFLPSVPALLELAAAMEVERDHALGVRAGSGFDDDLLRAANAENDHLDAELPAFEALGASAHLDRVIFDGADYGTGARAGSPEEEDYLGLPGLLDADQVAVLLHRRQADQLAAQRGASRGTKVEARPLTAAEELAALRRELNTLVNALVIRGGGSHAAIHAELRRTCGGCGQAARSSVGIGGMGRTRTQVSTVVAAPAEAVWDLVADLPRMGEWSPETAAVRWLGNASSAVPGARFAGHNRIGVRRWTTKATVVAAERGRTLTFDVSSLGLPVARWGYDFVPDPGGCRVTEWTEDRRGRLISCAGRLVTGVRDRAAHNERSMRTTLQRLKAAAERPGERAG